MDKSKRVKETKICQAKANKKWEIIIIIYKKYVMKSEQRTSFPQIYKNAHPPLQKY